MFSRLRAFVSPQCRPRFFDAAWYLETYTDVAAAGMDPLRHYLRYGRAEGRLPAFMITAARERDMRWGLAEDGFEALARFARGAVPDQTDADRLFAALACARAAARRGDWAGAATWLEGLAPQRDLTQGFCLPDHSLLAIEATVRTGAFGRARAQLDAAVRQFGAAGDLLLAEANLTGAERGHGPEWQRVLSRLYSAARAGGVAVQPNAAGRPAFDRLIGTKARKTGHKGPLVSVIMPARDAADTIGAALGSLMRQSWQALEIIVVDNGSTDGTAGIVRRLAAQDRRIRLLDGAAEPGAYAARNLGVSDAAGEVLTVLDADDWAHPERIERQVRALLKAPETVVATVSDWVRTTPDLIFTRWWREDGLVHRDVSSLMIRRAARARLGYWDRVRAGADTEYIARLEAVYGAGAVRQVLPGVPLSFGRTRQGSLTQASETSISTHLFGARRDYAAASRRWHGLRDPEKPLPRVPADRPFEVPEALRISPPGPAPQGSLYDNGWAMQTYAVLRGGEASSAEHYAAQGEAAGLSPGPDFSPSAYRMAYGPFEGSALQHYNDIGRAAGHAALPDFLGALDGGAAGRDILVFGHQAGSEIFGAERCLVDFLDSAIAAGAVPSVVLPHILNESYLEALRARCRTVFVRPYGWRFGDVPPHPRTVQDLAALIRATGAREVHQNTAVLEAPLAAARAAGVPAVVHVHELPAEDPRLCMGLGLTASELRARLLAQPGKLVANSQAVLDWLGAAPERTMLVPNRVDEELFDLPFAPPPTKRVGLIGSLAVKKGVADALDVARLARTQGLDLRFVLVGPRSADLETLRPWPPNVEHAGYAPRPAEAMAHCDIVLSLSHFAESFGRTVLEAMAAGRPVICYDRGVPPRLVGGDGVAGRVTERNTPASALAALTALLPALDTASEAARARARALQSEAKAQAQGLFQRPGFSALGPAP